MKKVVLNDNEVMTLDEVAAKLHRMYSWTAHTTNAKKGEICFTEICGRRFVLALDGLVREIVKGEVRKSPNRSRSIDFREDMDLVDMFWAKDEAGNSVMIYRY